MDDPEEVPMPDRLPDPASWRRADVRAGRGPRARYVTLAMRHGHPVAYVWTARGPGSWPEVAFEFSADGLMHPEAGVLDLAATATAEAARFAVDELGVAPASAEAMGVRVCSGWRSTPGAGALDTPAGPDLRESA